MIDLLIYIKINYIINLIIMASKKEYGIEEHVYEVLLDLFKLETSSHFRYPVDVV